MERQAVQSSNLQSIGYDEKTQTLEVEFIRGDVYQYTNVPQHVYDELMSAKSLGKYLNQHIARQYDFSKAD